MIGLKAPEGGARHLIWLPGSKTGHNGSESLMGVCQTARLCFLKRVTIVAGAASPERPRLRHGLRGLGRHLAATSAPRPHRGTPQRPRAQIQAATEHRLHPARPISAARARLHLRLAPALAAHNLRAGTEPPGTRPHDRARNRWHPSLLHLWSPTPHSACPHSRTGQILPRTRGKRNVPQCSPAYHGFQKLGHPLEAANPRPCVLHCAFALGSSCHRQSLSPNLLHLWPQRCGQLLRGPQQGPCAYHVVNPGGLQDSSPAVHDAGTDFTTPGKHSEARTRNLQRGRAPEASWLELRDQALRLPGPHDTAPRGRLTLAGAHRPSVVFLKLFKPAPCVCFSLCVVRRVRGGADERERRWS